MQMPGRQFKAGSPYRYGFNGKENDKEVKGEGNQQDYGMRIYDPRLGKFLSVDPITNKYPELTPYQFASNRPIDGIDLDGLEWWKKAIYLISPISGAASDKDIQEGFTKQAMEFLHGIKGLPSAVDNFVDAFGKLGTPGTPFINTQQVKQQVLMQAMAEGGVASIVSLWDLTKAAAKGNKQAIGALGFEAMLFIIPGGKQSRAASTIPRGFKSAAQFKKVGQELAIALEKSGIKFEEIGVQGSSVTGKSYRTGEPFRWGGKKPSDIDAFVLLKEDIPIKGGDKRPDFIHPDKLLKKYPALKEWSDKWTKILNRDITPAAIKPKNKLNFNGI